ncbi:MAG: hypothetical protein LH654_09700, partial [Thermoleophilia bacterium]|nr:hypothetical protein [Thermoleophilia bacterium]
MEAGAATQSRLIGAILVENGLITRDQLVRALELQEKTGERLGEIVVAEFDVPRIELASILAEQWAAIEGTASGGTVKPAAKLRVVAAPSPDNIATRRPIGEIFLELGFIDQTQLDAALERQRETGARIGEVLVEQGSLTRLDLASALAEQWSSLEKLRPPSLEARVEGTSRERSSAEDLACVAGTLETRVDALEGRDPSDAVAKLRLELDELRSRPNDVTAIAELRAMVERLEVQPGTPGQIETLVSEIVAVSVRLDDLTTIGDLESRIDAAALQAEAAGNEARRLSAQLDALSSLEQRIDEVVARVPANGAIEGLIEQFRSELAVVATDQSHGVDATNDAAIASISSRVDVVAARLDDLAAGPTVDLQPALDALTERVEATAASATTETQGLGKRLASLENAAEEDGGALERIAAELEELEVRTRERLDGLGEWSADSTPLDAVQSRLDDLAESVAQVSWPLEDLATRVTALAGQGDTISSLESRIGELEAGVAEGSSAIALREEIRQVAESTAADRASLAETLLARVEEVAASGPREEELAELRARLDQVVALPGEDDMLRQKADYLASRLDTLGGVEKSIDEALAEVCSRVESLAADDSTAELAVRVSELAARLDDEALRERIESVATRIDTVGALEVSIADVRQSMSELESVRVADALASGSRLAGVEHVLGALATRDSVDAALAGLRAELDAVAAVSTTEELDQRTAELMARVDRMTSHVDESVLGVAEELTTRIDGNAADLGKRIEELAEGVTGLVGRGELDAAATRHAEWVRSELAALAEAGDVRAARLEESLAAVDLARITSEKQHSEHIEKSI